MLAEVHNSRRQPMVTVVGIDTEAAYVALAQQRVAWWTGCTVPLPPQPEGIPAEPTRPPPTGQLNLFS